MMRLVGKRLPQSPAVTAPSEREPFGFRATILMITITVTIQSCTPSDPLRGAPPSKREAFGEQMRLIGSLLEGAGWPTGQTEGVLLG